MTPCRKRERRWSARPYAFERHRRCQDSLSFVGACKAVQHPGLDWTRGDHVNAYPGRGDFECAAEEEKISKKTSLCGSPSRDVSNIPSQPASSSVGMSACLSA